MRELISAEISGQAGSLGLPCTKVTDFAGGLTAFSFYKDEPLYKDEVRERRGLLLIETDDFNRLAVLDERDLPSKIKDYFEEPLRKDESRDWTLIKNELRTAAEFVGSQLRADPSISQRVWANVDLGYIGLATGRHLQEPDIILDSEND